MEESIALKVDGLRRECDHRFLFIWLGITHTHMLQYHHLTASWFLWFSLWSMRHAMSLFLSEVSKRHPNELILMVMDKDGWHKAKDLKVPQNMRIIFLPPYSPELNPPEHLWEEIREKWFPNQVFHSLNGVESVLVDALDSLEQSPEKVASIAGFEWVINLSLKAA